MALWGRKQKKIEVPQTGPINPVKWVIDPSGRRRIVITLLSLTTLGLFFVAGCAQTGPTQDRGGVNCDTVESSAYASCAPVDETRDVDYVLIERNANDAPNLVVSCVAGMGYTSGSTARAQGEGGTSGGAQISRDKDWDPLCKAHQKQALVK